MAVAAKREGVKTGPARSARSAGRWTRIYVPVALLMTAIALTGFWRTYFGPLLAGKVQVPGFIHLHATVFVGWLALVIAQGVLAANGRVALHRKVGTIGMAYGAALVVVGLATGFAVFARRIAAGNVEQAQRLLFGPITDMMVFAPLLYAAWRYRNKPEIHKRLIVVATTMLLIAAVGRLQFWRPTPQSLTQIGIFVLIWLSPIYLAMIYDYLRTRTVHPVYVFGFLLLTVVRFRNPLRTSDVWMSISGWFVHLLQ